MSEQKCNTNSTAKYIRIVLSAIILILGAWFKNPIGLLGFFTLYTAFSGNCGASIRLPKKKDSQ